MSWGYTVLAKKVVDQEVIIRIKLLYSESVSVVVVNNKPLLASEDLSDREMSQACSGLVQG